MNNLKIEHHPFSTFIPVKMGCLILGSFPGKQHTEGNLDENAWFYGASLNQFWRILEQVYNRELKTREAKQNLFEKAGIGMTDIFTSVVRSKGTSLDENLDVISYNKEEIERMLKQYHPGVLCTSRLVEKEFRKMFPGYTDVDILPSPSPRYFKLSIEQKSKIYKQKLPAL